jgi:RNA polymerase sigma factor (sigma-70 family)
MDEFLTRLRRALHLSDGTEPTDAQLLARYVEHREDTAFAALVQRHGQMVFGVCRRALAVADAEDAFQATFLVLMRRAASVIPREQLAAWLHGVARRTALKARERAQRRFAHERTLPELPDVGAPAEPPREEALAVIDEELERLPSKYRAPVVLCDVEGLTREEAARRLGWVVGTLSWRLSAARKLLAERLTRRGVGLSVAALASATGAPPAVAGVPSPEVLSLAEQVLSAMTTTKLKFAGALCVALLAGIGTVAVAIPVAPAPVPNFGSPAFGRAEPKLLAELEHDAFVHTVAFSPDGKLLATSGGHKARPIFGLEKVVPVNLWNLQGRLLGTTELTDFHALDLLQFAHNSHLLVGGADPRLLDPLSGKVTARFQYKVPEKFRRGVETASFSADGKVLATVMEDGAVCLWDTATGKQQSHVPCKTGSVALAPDGKSLVFTNGRRDSITVWDVTTGKARTTFSSAGSSPGHLVVSPNGKLIAHTAHDTSEPYTGDVLLFLTDFDGIIARRLLFKRGKSRVVGEGEDRVAAVLFSPDGERLVTMSYDWGVHVWDVRTGDQLAALREMHVLSVALSPDGKTLAVGAKQFVKLWDISALRKKK